MFYRIGFATALTISIFCLSDRFAQAQPRGYAATQLNNIKSQNSIAQFTTGRIMQQVRNSAVPPAGVGGVNRQNFIGRGSSPLGGPASKPFSGLDRGPSVSPYLTLANPFSTPSDFYNIVRPQQDQRAFNDRISRQQYAQSRKLNQMAAQGPYDITGNENAAPTGHGTGFMQFNAFMNTGNYFPAPTGPKER
jgi:hypothetical protein